MNDQISTLFTEQLMFLFELTSDRIDSIFKNPHFSQKFRNILNDSKTHEHGCIKFYLELSLNNREKLLLSAKK